MAKTSILIGSLSSPKFAIRTAKMDFHELNASICVLEKICKMKYFGVQYINVFLVV